MGVCHHQLCNAVFIQLRHTFNASATAVLTSEVIHGHTFNIPQLSHGNDCIFAFDQIFNGNFVIIHAQGCFSVITIFITDKLNFFADHAEKQFFIRKDCF